MTFYWFLTPTKRISIFLMFKALGEFRECFMPLILTFELPVKRTIRCLDLKLHFLRNHICWEYEPRASKPLLPFDSSHSKLVKRSITTSCFKSALNKSCFHSMYDSFQKQVDRLLIAGYPKHLLTAVAESILQRLKREQDSQGTVGTQQK